MNNRYIYRITNIIIVIFLLTSAFNIKIYNSNAADSQILERLTLTGIAAQYDTSESSLSVMVGRFIQTFLSFLGIIFIILAIYGGYLWMTARGAEEKVEEAKSTLTNGVIGIVIIVTAYVITYFVLYYITKDYIKDSGF
jgi:uncharacterized membrane protein YidH (DUF202 family)